MSFTSPQRTSPSKSSSTTRDLSHLLSHEADPYEERDYRKITAPQRLNPLLVKIQTGKVKATTYDLPEAGFTYGRRDQYEQEGVKDLVNSWQTHHSAPSSVPGRDFVRLNRSAVIRGAVSSKDITDFRSMHDARVKQGYTITKGAPLNLDPEATYGRQNRPSTPIHDVLNNSYQRQAIIDAKRRQELAELKRLQAESQKAGKFGASQHTRASLGHLKLAPPPAKEPFKMDKFKNVAPRIGQQGLNTSGVFHANATNRQNEMLQEQYEQEQQQQQQQQQQSSSFRRSQSLSASGSLQTGSPQYEEKTQEVLRSH